MLREFGADNNGVVASQDAVTLKALIFYTSTFSAAGQGMDGFAARRSYEKLDRGAIRWAARADRRF
jgi:hypothetical protein